MYNKNINSRYVPVNLAKKLKTIGFNHHVLAKYQKLDEGANYGLQFLTRPKDCNGMDTAISAPSWQEVFDWFESLGFNSWIEKYDNDETYTFQIPSANLNKVQGYYKEKYDVRVACLEKLIEIYNKK